MLTNEIESSAFIKLIFKLVGEDIKKEIKYKLMIRDMGTVKTGEGEWEL